MNLDDVTPLVLTYNEAPNIGRCLDRLTWAREIVVVDSFSDDETLAIVARHRNARVVQRVFDSFAGQCNYGLREAGITSPWILSLDADYILTQDFIEALQTLEPAAEISAYSVPFVYCIFGKPLRGSAYGPIKSLFRREACEYVDDGHAHRLRVVRGRAVPLSASIEHDDRKPLARWVRSQVTYAQQEADKLATADPTTLGRADRLRQKLVLAPAAIFLYALVVQRGLLDGWAGWFYAFQRLFAELLLSLTLLERKLSGGK